MEKGTYVLYIVGWGYYGGRSEKYADMYNIVPLQYAKRFWDREEVETLKKKLEKADYTTTVEVEEVED